jgi:excisionase family DNA binding protein
MHRSSQRCRKSDPQYPVAMTETKDLAFDRLLDLLAERLANRLSQEPGRLYPRLLTVEQAAAYLGRTPEAIQNLTHSGKIPTVIDDRLVFLDRLDLERWIDEHKTGWV